MRLLGLELSDAGILVASQQAGHLLPVDDDALESPGFAIADKKALHVGRAAARQAYLRPRHILHEFWDQLNLDPLKYKAPQARNHAEVACAHLASLWERIRGHGDALVITVPGYATREQLGLILGIAQALSIPVQGFVSIPVAAATPSHPSRLRLHIDMHLHRFELTVLEASQHLRQIDSVSVAGKGLLALYTAWVTAIADAFVRATRFDPLHHAVSEQLLYDRLPHLLDQLQRESSTTIDIIASRKTYAVTLTREWFIETAARVFDDIRQMIARMQQQYGQPGQPLVIQVSQRIARLPGYQEALAVAQDTVWIELDPGASALGATQLWERMQPPDVSDNVSLFTSCPWPQSLTPADVRDGDLPSSQQRRPTHVLLGSLAYPITAQPLWIVLQQGGTLAVCEQADDAAQLCASIVQEGDEVVLITRGTHEVFVDAQRLDDRCVLQLGQTIRCQPSAETLRLIAGVNPDGT